MACTTAVARALKGKQVKYLDLSDTFLDDKGVLPADVMPDQLHPAVKGYQVWADGLKPMLTELLGASAVEDHAPPPTGDPSAQ